MWIKDEYREIMVEPQLNYIALKCATHSVPLLQLISIRFLLAMQIQHQVIAFQNNGESELETSREMEVTKRIFMPRLPGRESEKICRRRDIARDKERCSCLGSCRGPWSVGRCRFRLWSTCWAVVHVLTSHSDLTVAST